MRRRSDPGGEALRQRIMGLGEQSLRKSYYPELRRRLDELERFRTLLDQTNDAIFLVQLPAGSLSDLSGAACRMLSLEREAALGRPLAAVAPALSGLLHDPSSAAPRVTTLGPPGGEEIPVEVHASSVEFEGVRYLAVTARDISERARVEQAVRFLSHASVRLAASLDPDATVQAVASLAAEGLADLAAVYLRKPDGAVVRAALVTRRPEGRGACEELQRLHSTLQGDELGVQAALAAEEPQHRARLTGEILASMVPDPERLALWSSLRLCCTLVVPLTRQASVRGALLLANRVGSFDDPLSLKLAADFASRGAVALQNAQLLRDAQEANRIKDEFLAVVSHELRTPLTSILGWASMLQAKAGGSADLGRGLGVIERNARSLAQIIDDLLDVSRVAAGKVRLEITPLDLSRVIEGAAESLRPIAAARGLSLTVSAARLPPFLGDAKRLEQVVWNLISNALKFTPEGGRVEVALERSAEGPRIAVTDTGRGIAPAFLPFVFEPFRQADSSTTRRIGGLGLGLAIVQRLVALHGGSVRAQSAGEGQGATFIVDLPPRWASPPAEASAAEAPRRAGGIGGARVLVVDDDPDTRDLVGEMLRDAGAEVLLAPGAREALETLARTSPSILVSDLAMPDMDGFALLRAVRERGLRFPAVALSAMVRAQDVRRALDAGFDRFLGKPVNAEALASTLGDLLPAPLRA